MEETIKIKQQKKIVMVCLNCGSTNIKIEKTGYRSDTDFVCEDCGIKTQRTRLWS